MTALEPGRKQPRSALRGPSRGRRPRVAMIVAAISATALILMRRPRSRGPSATSPDVAAPATPPANATRSKGTASLKLDSDPLGSLVNLRLLLRARPRFDRKTGDNAGDMTGDCSHSPNPGRAPQGSRCTRFKSPARGGVGSRVFDILVNGVAMRRGFDVFKEARGEARSVTWSAHGLEPDAQGKLNIALTPVRNYACVNAVEVLDESK